MLRTSYRSDRANHPWVSFVPTLFFFFHFAWSIQAGQSFLQFTYWNKDYVYLDEIDQRKKEKQCVLKGYSSSYLPRYGGYAASRNYGEEVTPTSTPEHHGPHTSADDASAACKHRTKQPPNMWTTMLVWTAAVVLLPAPRAVSLIFLFNLISFVSLSSFFTIYSDRSFISKR